jgi:hypothetical protein
MQIPPFVYSNYIYACSNFYVTKNKENTACAELLTTAEADIALLKKK